MSDAPACESKMLQHVGQTDPSPEGWSKHKPAGGQPPYLWLGFNGLHQSFFPFTLSYISPLLSLCLSLSFFFSACMHAQHSPGSAVRNRRSIWNAASALHVVSEWPIISHEGKHWEFININKQLLFWAHWLPTPHPTPSPSFSLFLSKRTKGDLMNSVAQGESSRAITQGVANGPGAAVQHTSGSTETSF